MKAERGAEERGNSTVANDCWIAKIEELEEENNKMKSLLSRTFTLISNETEGGCLSHMVSVEGRCIWYDRLRPIRDEMRKILGL